MRLLIDGYNLMFAKGLLGKRQGSDAFRKARTRFLNGLADAIGPVEAHLTTVVFDASHPPVELPRQSTHKGMTIVFAVDDESADERIERLIAAHPSPRSLNVVSSDHRIRQAAARRRATATTADDFLARLESPERSPATTPSVPDPERVRREELPADETAFWLEQFGAIEDLPETRAALGRDIGIPTDAELAEIEREVEQEFEPDKRAHKRRGRK